MASPCSMTCTSIGPERYRLTVTGDGVSGSVDSSPFDVLALPAMTIEKIDDVDPVDPNDEVTYTITYGNEGLANGQNVVIRETLPAGMQFVSATEDGVFSGGVITWNVGTVDANTSGRTVELRRPRYRRLGRRRHSHQQQPHDYRPGHATRRDK